jgi:hypothetical protein
MIFLQIVFGMNVIRGLVVAREHGYGSNAEVYAAGAKLHALQGDLLAVYK